MSDIAGKVVHRRITVHEIAPDGTKILRQKPYYRVPHTVYRADIQDTVNLYVEPKGFEAFAAKIVWQAIRRLIAIYRTMVDDDAELEESLINAIFENDTVIEDPYQ